MASARLLLPLSNSFPALFIYSIDRSGVDSELRFFLACSQATSRWKNEKKPEMNRTNWIWTKKINLPSPGKILFRLSLAKIFFLSEKLFSHTWRHHHNPFINDVSPSEHGWTKLNENCDNDTTHYLIPNSNLGRLTFRPRTPLKLWFNLKQCSVECRAMIKSKVTQGVSLHGYMVIRRNS